MKRIRLIFFFALPLISVKAQPKDSAQQRAIRDYTLLNQSLNEPGIKNKNVKMMIVDFPPLTVASPHRHPCPTFGYVLEGSIESVFEGRNYIYKKGDSFYEFTNGLHAKTRNPDPVIPAKLLVFFIIDPNQETSIREH